MTGIGVLDVCTGVLYDFQAQSWRLSFKILVARQLIMLLPNMQFSQHYPPILVNLH